MAEIPVLETARLRLRAHGPGDLDVCAGMWADPAVTRYISGRPFTREEVWARLLRYAGHWSWFEFGFWLLEERSTRRFIGEIGLADFKRDIEPPLPPGPEASWILASHAHGKGYATEALTAVTAWYAGKARAKTIFCMIQPDNKPSIQVALKCGFRKMQRSLYKGQPTTVYIRP